MNHVQVNPNFLGITKMVWGMEKMAFWITHPLKPTHRFGKETPLGADVVAARWGVEASRSTTKMGFFKQFLLQADLMTKNCF